MKLCVLGFLLLAQSCGGSVTRCPDCSTTWHSMDTRETATATSTPPMSSSAQPMVAAETTPVSPAASSSEPPPPASSAAAASSTSSSTTSTTSRSTTSRSTSAGTTSTTAVPGVLPAVSDEVLSVGEGLSGLAGAIREHLPAHENALMSPLSIGSLLAAVQKGALGNTGRQIEKLLGLHSSADQVYWGQLAAALSAVQKFPAVGTQLVNAIFMEKRLVTNEDFADYVLSTLTCTVVPVDFITDQQEASDFINDWVSDNTHSKIPNILQESVAADTVIALASAFYFNGAWNDQFPKEDTKREKFTISNSETIEVDMMHHHSSALIAIDTGAQVEVVGVPYKDDDFALFFVLPSQVGVAGLKDLENRMSATEIVYILNTAYWAEVSYYVPRMRLETTLELNNALFGAGVNDLFVSTRSELQPMVDYVNRTATLFVNKVVHSMVLEVTEAGTEPPAAPPTGPHAVHTNGKDGLIEVRVDRPFILVLLHRPTGIPIVWASIVRPTPSYQLGRR